MRTQPIELNRSAHLHSKVLIKLANVKVTLLIIIMKGHKNWGRSLANEERQMSHLYLAKVKRRSQGTINFTSALEGYEANYSRTILWVHERDKGDREHSGRIYQSLIISDQPNYIP